MSSISNIAITIDQPWASLIVLGIKDIENRTWSPDSSVFGRRIIIHSSKNYDHLGAFMLMNDHGIICHSRNFPRGAIIGTAVLEEIVTDSDSVWFRGPYGWRFSSPQLLHPVPCQGNRKLWNVPPSAWERVLAASRAPLNPDDFLEIKSICKTDIMTQI